MEKQEDNQEESLVSQAKKDKERIRLRSLTQFLLMVKSQKQREKGNQFYKPLSARYHNSKSFKKGKEKEEDEESEEDPEEEHKNESNVNHQKEEKGKAVEKKSFKEKVEKHAKTISLKGKPKKKSSNAIGLAKQFPWPYDMASQNCKPKDSNINL